MSGRVSLEERPGEKTTDLGNAIVYLEPGSDAKIATAQRFGVDQVINYRRDNFAQVVVDLTGGRGVDMVFDAVGAATLVDDTKALKTFGTLVSFGGASGPAQLSAGSQKKAANEGACAAAKATCAA